MGKVKNVDLGLLLGILAVIFLLFTALIHFCWIGRYLQKYGRTTGNSALSSCDLRLCSEYV